MNKLIIIFSLLLFELPVNAANLTVINDTPNSIRIQSLENKCSKPIVEQNKPAYILSKESKSFTIENVVHIYTICGSGYCVNSAIGINNKYNDYTIVAYIRDGRLFTKEYPDIWPGNLKCN